ncbi:MAG: alpha/beta fold hydrolase [Oscillospiraceae bacterium]|nr:alpha/beta fold hydrolase [Oscillospiraceae bacterium]
MPGNDCTVKLPSGAEMYYARFGKGDKVLVMIPGLNIVDMRSTASNLAFFYRRFAKDFTVYVFDRRAGRDEGADIRSMADDVSAAMTVLGLSDVYVLGVSQGGMIAQYLAVYHPELVKKLVLGVTAAKTNPVMTEGVREWISWAEKGDIEAVLTRTYERMYTDEQIKKYRRIIPVMMRFVRFMSPERFADHARAILSLDIYDRLDRIKCPVLVLGGEKDSMTTPDASREIADKLGCECYIFPDEGHAAYLNDDFNKRVYEFFK